jgi:DnaJ-class molecular chaperone
MSSLPSDRRREALRLLELQDPVELPEIVAAYRRLARRHHPDVGGDPEAFRTLTVARDLLLADAHRTASVRAGSTTARSVTARQRPHRRILRGLRRRLGRKGGQRRYLA